MAQPESLDWRVSMGGDGDGGCLEEPSGGSASLGSCRLCGTLGKAIQQLKIKN